MSSYVKLHRKIKEYDNPVARYIFMDFIRDAQYKDKAVKIKGEWHERPAGYLYTSVSAINKRSSCFSTQQIRTALKRLETDKMIRIETTNGFHEIFIVNYAKYQGVKSTANNKQECNTNYALVNKQKCKIANSSISKMKKSNRTQVNQKWLKAIKYSPGSVFEGRLEPLQLHWRVKRYGLEKVQYWITKLEKKYHGKSIRTADGLLHTALKDGEWWERQAFQVRRSREIEDQHNEQKKADKLEFLNGFSLDIEKETTQEDKPMDSEKIYQEALKYESVVNNATETLKIEMNPSNHLFNRTLKYRIIEMYLRLIPSKAF